MTPIEAVYGSDKEGLVCAYAFRPGGPGRVADAEEAAGLVASTESDGSFLWLHFNLSNAASERWLHQHLKLPESFLALVREGSSSTRIEREGDWLTAVLNDVLFDFSFDASQVATLSICADRRLLVSARSKPLRSIDRLRAAVREGETFRSPVDLLAHLLREEAEVLVRIIRDSTARVNAVEDRLLANRVGSSRTELGALRRVLVRLQRLLAPEPAALLRLLSRPPAWLSEEDREDLRESAEEFSTAVGDSRTLVERVTLLQDELAALISEQNNRSLFVLTVVTVLALPINIVTGLFGMNVGGVPFAGYAAGFWVIVASVASFTGVFAYLAFNRWMN